MSLSTPTHFAHRLLWVLDLNNFTPPTGTLSLIRISTMVGCIVYVEEMAPSNLVELNPYCNLTERIVCSAINYTANPILLQTVLAFLSQGSEWIRTMTMGRTCRRIIHHAEDSFVMLNKIALRGGHSLKLNGCTKKENCSLSSLLFFI